jgi:hypothetical protein
VESEKTFRLELIRREEEWKLSKEIFDESLRLQNEEISGIRRDTQQQRHQIMLEERQRADDEQVELQSRHKVD